MRCQELGFAVLVVTTLTMFVMYLYMNPAGAGFKKSAYTTPSVPVITVQERPLTRTFEENERSHSFNAEGVKDDPDLDRDHHELWKHTTRSTSKITTDKAETQSPDAEPCLSIRGTYHQLDRICAEKAEYCHTVVIGIFAQSVDREIVARLLRYEGNPFSIAETAVRLVPAKGVEERIDLCPRDYYNWTVDNSYIVAEYVAGMIASMFLLSSLSLNSPDYGKQVLVIGAGAGGMDMALHSLKPHVNITGVDINELVLNIGKKWFGSVESETHHLIAQDGVVFAENAVAGGRKFDVIAVDACGDDLSFLCPHKVFREETALQNFKQLLTPTGVLTYNLATFSHRRSDFLRLLKRYFACRAMLIPYRANVVLTCALEWNPDSKRLLKLEDLIKRMKIEYVLKGAKFVDFEELKY